MYNKQMKTAAGHPEIQQIKSWLKTGSINVFGLPFAGKDTLCRKLATLMEGVVIGGGDILRDKSAPPHIRNHIDKGSLAPTEDYLRIILPYFSNEKFKDKPLILSSVGRWHGEEAAVLEATAESGHPLLVAIYLQITFDELHNRLRKAQKLGDRGARNDDAEHVLDKRLEEFNTKTMPVIDFYRDQGMLIETDGMKPKDEVLKSILDELSKRAMIN